MPGKIYSSDNGDNIRKKYPRAHIHRKKIDLNSLSKLKPVKGSFGRRKNAPETWSGLVDRHENPVQSSMYESNMEGVEQAQTHYSEDRAAKNYTNHRTANFGGSGGSQQTQNVNSFEGSSRQFYDFRATLTFAQLPPQDQWKELNFLRRFMYLHDEIIGPGLDMLSEIPWGNANLVSDDPEIERIFQNAIDDSSLFDFMPRMTLHYLIHGEVIPWQWWSDEKGYWTYLYSLDPNDVRVASFPYSYADAVLQLEPSTFVKLVATSSEPAYREIQRQMPPFMLQTLRAGKPIILDPENTTYIVRENFPLYEEYTNEIRGQSILDRLFRVWVLYEKISEADIAIADNFIYPINLIKLGDDTWKPTGEDLSSFASMVEDAKFDVRPFIVYHNAVELDRVEYSGSFTDMTDRFERMDDLKLIGLGIAKDMLFGESTLASSRTEMQIFVMRLSTMKSRLESKWLYPKFMDPIAEKNEMFDLSEAQSRHNVRVKQYKKVWFRDPENPRSGKWYADRIDDRPLATPTIKWETQLHSVADSDYLDQMRELYDMRIDPEEGIIAPSTMAKVQGFDYEEQLRQKKEDLDLREKIMTPEGEEGEGGDDNERGPIRRFKKEEPNTVLSFLRKTAKQWFGSSEENHSEVSMNDIEKIQNFFSEQEGVLYKEGLRDTPLQKGERAYELFSGRTHGRRQGNLEDAIVIPEEFKQSQRQSASFWESLNYEPTFSEDAKQHLKHAENVLERLIDESDSEDFDDVLSAFFDEYPEFFDFIYSEGKQYSYNHQPSEEIFKIREGLGLIADEYRDERYASTISNFEDADVLEALKDTFSDNLKSVDKETAEKIRKTLEDKMVDGHPEKLSDEVTKEMAKTKKQKLKDFRQQAKPKIRMVMRSAFANAYNLAILRGLLEQGYTKFRWIANRDACPVCQKLDRKTFNIESFLKKHKNEWVRASHPNCLCTAEAAGKRKASENLKELHQSLRKYGVTNYEIVKDVQSDERFAKKLGKYIETPRSVEASVIDGTVLISEWCKAKVSAYLKAFMGYKLQEKDLKFAANTQKLEFPHFQAKHIEFLLESGVLEDDGQYLWLSPEFTRSSQRRSGTKIIDDLLEARKYIVRWNHKGQPIYDNSDYWQISEKNPVQSVVRHSDDFFFAPDILRRNNPKLWSVLVRKFGNPNRYIKREWMDDDPITNDQ